MSWKPLLIRCVDCRDCCSDRWVPWMKRESSNVSRATSSPTSKLIAQPSKGSGFRFDRGEELGGLFEVDEFAELR